MILSLDDYIHAVRACDDERQLKDEFDIYDNWLLLLYGEQGALRAKISTDLAERGWRVLSAKEIEYTTMETILQSQDGLVTLRLSPEPYDRFVNGTSDRARGEAHTCFAMLHPKQLLQYTKELKSATLDVCEYVREKGIRSGFPDYDND